MPCSSRSGVRVRYLPSKLTSHRAAPGCVKQRGNKVQSSFSPLTNPGASRSSPRPVRQIR
jgi:hypothetical protein